MEGWITEELGSLATVSAGNSAPQDKELFKGGQHPFVRTSDVGKIRFGTIESTSDYLNDAGITKLRLYPEGTILFPKSGASTFLNHRVMMGMDGFVASHLATIQAKQGKVLPRYLLYFLHTVEAQDLVQDHDYPSLTLSLIKSISIPLPPLPEQERIVAILDEAFAAIATATANAEKNLANARELFESQLEQAFTPDGEEGWTESTIKRLVDDGILSKPLDGNHGEIHPKKADFVDSGVPFIMAADLIRGSVDQENCTFISHEQADSLRKGFARDGDVLLSHKGTIGRTAVLNTELEYVMLTPQVTYYRIDDPAVLFNRFLYYSIQTPRFLDALWKVAKQGSTRAYIGITKQLELLVAYPSLEEQVRIVKRLDRLTKARSSLVRTFTAKKEKLANLKQSLLHKAFTGELTADSKAADRSLSEAGV